MRRLLSAMLATLLCAASPLPDVTGPDTQNPPNQAQMNQLRRAINQNFLLNDGLTLPAVNVKAKLYGAKGDVATFADGVITAGYASFSSASTTFTSADCAPPGIGCTGIVNKKIVISGAGAAGEPFATSISSFTSAHVVGLAASASTTVPTRTPTMAAPAVATAQSGAGSYVPADTVTLTDGSVLTVSTTKVQSASAGTNGVGCTDGTYTVTGTTGLGPNGVTTSNLFTASVTMATNVPTVNSISGGGNYATNPTVLANEPVTGVAGCGTQPKLALKMGVKTAYVSAPAASASAPPDPVAQSSTSGAGTGATFNLAGTWVATGQGYYGTDDAAAFAAALTAGSVGANSHFAAGAGGTDANYVWVPGGKYLIGTQLELPTTAPVVLMGSGNDAATLFAGASGMTAVVHRGTGFGYGAGVRDLTVNAFRLADHAIYLEGGARGVYSHVVGFNGLVSEWRCGNGTVQTYENTFTAILGQTDNNVFLPSQRGTYNFWSNASPTNGCTDSVVDGKSTFANASTANIFDDAGGLNTYVAPHIYGYPVRSFYATYGIRLNGAAILVSPELDGATTAAVYVAGSRVIVVGGNAQWAGDSQGSAVAALIATGVAGASVTNLSATNSTLGVSAANVVSQAGTADSSTIVANNPGASYWTPVLAPLGTATSVGVQIGGPTFGFYRDGTNIYTLYNGVFLRSSNSSAETMAVPFVLKVSTVAALGACGAGQANWIRYVTDASAPTYGATLSGGGAVGAIAICDGISAWKAH